MQRVAPKSTRDFLIKVGLVSMAMTTFLILLRLFFPEPDILRCESPAAHRTAVVARGRGTNVGITMKDSDGELIWANIFHAPEFTCKAALGEDWNEQK